MILLGFSISLSMYLKLYDYMHSVSDTYVMVKCNHNLLSSKNIGSFPTYLYSHQAMPCRAFYLYLSSYHETESLKIVLLVWKVLMLRFKYLKKLTEVNGYMY